MYHCSELKKFFESKITKIEHCARKQQQQWRTYHSSEIQTEWVCNVTHAFVKQIDLHQELGLGIISF